MGLDNFTDSDSQSSSNTQSSDSGGESDSSNNQSQKKNDPYKRVGVGRKQKVIQTEEQWEQIVDYVENSMGFDIQTVMSWPTDKQYRALHVAIMNSSGEETEEFNIRDQCFVCGKTFKFPHDWDFLKYNDSAVCGSHDYKEVKNTYRSNRGEYED